MKEIDIHKSIYDPLGTPLDYPGKRIKSPVLVMEGRYQPLNISDDFNSFFTSEGVSVDEILLQRRSAPLRERVAQIAYGANGNLENITWKLHQYNKNHPPVSQLFAALPCYLPDADVVACNIGYWGYVYSGLLTTNSCNGLRPYLSGTSCPVTLLLLDESQLRAIHHSEGVVAPGGQQHGVSCGVAELTVHLDNKATCLAQAYSLSVPFLSFDGEKPVAFKSVKTKGRTGYPELSQEEMLLLINRHLRAEPEVAGRIPIAETLRQQSITLLLNGIDATRKLSTTPFYSTVRSSIMDNLALRDRDGRIRCGLEGTAAVKSDIDAWLLQPLFNPRVSSDI